MRTEWSVNRVILDKTIPILGNGFHNKYRMSFKANWLVAQGGLGSLEPLNAFESLLNRMLVL